MCRGLAYLAALVLLLGSISAAGENIDPDNDGSQYAYGENVGWLNFEPLEGLGVTVSDTQLTGYVWGENIGWISLSCENTSSCERVDYGVANDGDGNLSGYAWAGNVGWINFDPEVPGDPNHYGVTIDQQGHFAGWAWGENIGWINFRSTHLFGYNVKACKVSFEDAANFLDGWLASGPAQAADLNSDDEVDFADYSILADHWLGYCPDGWSLK